jgi:aminoglycoside 6'-N-acetyltransferase I
MRVVDLLPEDEECVRQAAAVLVAAFAGWPGDWDDVASALAEVRDSFGPGRVSLVALDDDGHVAGWVGGIRQYDGHAWELHPLAVAPARQRRGIGRMLVAALEARVRARGGTTVYLGTDDVAGLTSLTGVDLYPDVWAHVARIENPGGHPYGFYQKLGYAIVGVIPDANGFGRPDIIMARRIAPAPSSRGGGATPA